MLDNKVLTNDSKWSSIVSTMIKHLPQKININKKGHKMSKQNKTNIKVAAFVAFLVSFTVGAVVVGLPMLNEQQIVSLAYFGLGIWLTVQFLQRLVK